MTEQHVQALKQDLREEFYLDLDEYLVEESAGRFTGNFLELQLDSVFQPIAWPTRPSILRPCCAPPSGGAKPITPPFVFRYADEMGTLVKFDRICRTLHMLNSLQFSGELDLLFLNVHPKLLVSVNAHGRVFEGILHAHSVPTHKVVIEIQESAVEDEGSLSQAITNYRDRGYKIAIDDFGRRHSNLERLWRLAPDFVKFDASIVQDTSANPKIQRLLPKLVEIVHETGGQAVIEGIETRQHLDLALASGARYFQGYFLGMPTAARDWIESPPAERE